MSQPDSTPTAEAPTLTNDEIDLLNSLFDLAREGDAQLLDYLDAGVPVNLTNHAGDTLLILASYHRHLGLVRELVARGSDVERVNDRGQTALGCAVFRQDGELVQLLVQAGADPDGGARTAREVAQFFGLEEMARLLG